MTHTMKSLVFSLILTAASAVAETRVATVRVPFAFVAGSVEMPAGDYSISKSEQRVLFLRSGGKTVALIPVGSTYPRFGSANSVRFSKVGGQNVLKELVIDGSEGYLLHR